ncbi:MAG: hypothetical protein KIT84_31380 [Labilithrix sp.]|nr:hypothetical protein [Labilithrix sp.]MCW5815572.1 hypothetical protein [Labilithrix sp.]
MTLRPSFALVLVAASLMACTAEGLPEEPVTATDSAIVGSVMTDTAEVEADRIVFERGTVPAVLKSRIDAYAKGRANGTNRQNVDDVILAGDRQKDAVGEDGRIREGIGNPYGFVRRAVGWEDRGDKTIVLTERVSLEEAFQEFREGKIIQVGTQPMEQGLAPRFNTELRYRIPVIDMSGREIWSNGNASVRLKTAYVNLDTTVDLGADISWFSLSDAHVIIDANVDSELVVETRLVGALDKSFSKEVYRGSWPIGSVGPIPVTLGLVAKVGCDVHAKAAVTASAGVGMNIALKGGVKYEKDSGTSPVWENPRFTPRAISPQLTVKGDATTRCYVRPQLSLMLFDAAGPTLTPDLAARVDATYPPLRATLTGEIGLDVGGKLEVFGKNLGEVNYHLFTVDKQLWQYRP